MSLIDNMEKRRESHLKKAENRLRGTKRRKIRQGERQDPLERIQDRLKRKHDALGGDDNG